jgi:hypothetical protein
MTLKKVGLVLIALLCAVPAHGQTVEAKHESWWHRYKYPVLMSIATFAGRVAVTESSVACQHTRHCVELNSLGHHPSVLNTRLYGYGSGAAIVGMNFLWWHLTEEKDVRNLRVLEAFWNLPLNIMDGVTTSRNLQVANTSHKATRLAIPPFHRETVGAPGL